MPEKDELLAREAERAFTAEEQRAGTLDGKAEKYAAVTATVLGLSALGLGDVHAVGRGWASVSGALGIAAMLALAAALLLALGALRVQRYLGIVPVTTGFAEQIRAPDVSDREFRDAITDDYLRSFRHNHVVNRERGRMLLWAGYCLGIGFVLALASHLLRGS